MCFGDKEVPMSQHSNASFLHNEQSAEKKRKPKNQTTSYSFLLPFFA